MVWWDPVLLDRKGEERRGIRREDLITKDADPQAVAADRALYEEWRQQRAETLTLATQPSLRIVTATDYVKLPPPGPGGLLESADRADNVAVLDAGFAGFRPGGRRFGVLVHALLAVVPLDASREAIVDLATVHARVLG